MTTTPNLYPTGPLTPDIVPQTAAQLAAWRALSKVIDPEIRRPITELGMVASVDLTGDDLVVMIQIGRAHV